MGYERAVIPVWHFLTSVMISSADVTAALFQAFCLGGAMPLDTFDCAVLMFVPSSKGTVALSLGYTIQGQATMSYGW